MVQIAVLLGGMFLSLPAQSFAVLKSALHGIGRRQISLIMFLSEFSNFPCDFLCDPWII